MAGTITHYWDGTKLVVTSDSGTSSCDLKGAQGDMGIRGAQGAPGIVLIDSNLATAGYGADAKAVGDRLTAIEEQLEIVDRTIRVKEITQSYANAQHAGGSEKIVDGLPTRVLEIQGNTICDEATNTLKNTTLKGIKCTGKNLINADPNISWTTVKTFNIDLPAGTYTLQCDDSSSNGTNKPAAVLFNVANGIDSSSDRILLRTQLEKSATKTLKGGNYSLNIYSNDYNYDNSIAVKGTIVNLMLSKGEGVKEYEAYKESYYQLPSTPAVINLRKWDTLYPQTNKKITGSRTYAFTGTENWTEFSSTYEAMVYCTDALDTLAKDYAQVVCNDSRFKNSTDGSLYSVYFSIGSNKLIFIVPKADFPTVDSWKEYLAQQNSAGTSLQILYQLKMPNTETVELPKEYRAYTDGIEALVYSSSAYVPPTIKQEYYVWVGGSEE